MAARDDDVDLLGARGHAFADLLNAQVIGRKAGRKARRDSCDGNVGALKRTHGGGDHIVIDADRANGQAVHPELVQKRGGDRLTGLCTKALHAAFGVVARKGGEVDQADRFQKPSGLEFLLHRAAARQGRSAAFDGGSVGLNRSDPIEIKLHALVAGQVQLGQMGRCRDGRRVSRFGFQDGLPQVRLASHAARLLARFDHLVKLFMRAEPDSAETACETGAGSRRGGRERACGSGSDWGCRNRPRSRGAGLRCR